MASHHKSPGALEISMGRDRIQAGGLQQPLHGITLIMVMLH
jgi:hypothetical protein